MAVSLKNEVRPISVTTTCKQVHQRLRCTKPKGSAFEDITGRKTHYP